MTEHDYLWASNLARLRMLRSQLREFVPLGARDTTDLSALNQILHATIARYEEQAEQRVAPADP